MAENGEHKEFLNGSSNKTKVDDVAFLRDRGVRAWTVMTASFLCQGVLFGVINCYGVLYPELFERLKASGVENASGKAALAGSLTMGMTFFISPVSGVLTDHIGIRKTTFLGGAIAAIGMLLSSFCIDNITAFCFTYGIIYGFGGALTYTPSLAILGHYFDRYLGLVNGIVTAGSSSFTIVMPYVLDFLLRRFGMSWTLRVLALMAACLMLLAFLFKPTTKATLKRKGTAKDIFNIGVLTNAKYIIWITVIGLCLFGYFVPYVYMIKFVKSNFGESVDNKLPILCIGLMSGISRPIIGIITDRTKVDKIMLQQLAFFALGVLTILLPFSTSSFALLLLISLGMGITDGCFISLLGPVAFEICGREGAAQAIGFLLGVCSIPLCLGPYIAGIIYESQGSYTLPLILAGINPAVASFGMLIIRCTNNDKAINSAVESQLTKADEEKGRLVNGAKSSQNVASVEPSLCRRSYDYSVL